MEERRRCTTVRQLELMVEFLDEHRDLALGRVRSKEARAVAARLWSECADTLKAEGPARTGKEWAKVWNDHKCRVRAKLVNINANQRATGGGPSNTSSLSPLEERVANIIGRDIGPLPNVRHDQFSANNDEGEMVVVLEQQANVEEQQQQEPDNEIASLPIISLNELHAAPEANMSPPREQARPVTSEPSMMGQSPSTQNTPRRTTEQVRGGRRRRRIIAHAPDAPTQSTRSALEESRLLVLRIEEMRAEAALANAQAVASFAQSFRLIAESIERFSQKFCQPQNPHQT